MDLKKLEFDLVNQIEQLLTGNKLSYFAYNRGVEQKEGATAVKIELKGSKKAMTVLLRHQTETDALSLELLEQEGAVGEDEFDKLKEILRKEEGALKPYFH